MEDFGDIIFYLIAGAVGIIGAIGRKKFKKGQQKVSAEPEMTPEVKESIPVMEHEFDRQVGNILIEDEDIWDEKSMEETKPVEKEEIVMTASSKGAYEQTLASAYVWEGISSLEDTIIGNELVDADLAAADSDIITSTDLSIESSVASDLADDFDLEEAIIYSEIINRKDYV